MSRSNTAMFLLSVLLLCSCVTETIAPGWKKEVVDSRGQVGFYNDMP